MSFSNIMLGLRWGLVTAFILPLHSRQCARQSSHYIPTANSNVQELKPSPLAIFPNPPYLSGIYLLNTISIMHRTSSIGDIEVYGKKRECFVQTVVVGHPHTSSLARHVLSQPPRVRIVCLASSSHLTLTLTLRSSNRVLGTER